jgi:hypothetical protein
MNMESVAWSIFEALVLGAGFLFCVAACVALAGWGILRRSGPALGLSAALLLPSAFLLSFQPLIRNVDELPYWLAHYTIWSSLALSPLVALLGVWKKSTIILLISTALAVPFGVWFFFYPGTRFYLLLPGLHLLSAAAVRGRFFWMAWTMLVVIWGLAALLLLVLGGLVFLTSP